VLKPVDALARVADTNHDVDFSAVGDHECAARVSAADSLGDSSG
jgi:hypothetical protein